MSINPCPFCGSNKVTVRPQYNTTLRMNGSGRELICVYLNHHCEKITDDQDNFVNSTLTIRARTEEQAIETWNSRIKLSM